MQKAIICTTGAKSPPTDSWNDIVPLVTVLEALTWTFLLKPMEKNHSSGQDLKDRERKRERETGHIPGVIQTDQSKKKQIIPTHHIDNVSIVSASLANKIILNGHWMSGATFQLLLKRLYRQFTECWTFGSSRLEKFNHPCIWTEVRRLVTIRIHCGGHCLENNEWNWIILREDFI